MEDLGGMISTGELLTYLPELSGNFTAQSSSSKAGEWRRKLIFPYEVSLFIIRMHLLTCHKFYDMGPVALLPLEGSRAANFYRP
jgi:hypothetical protein